MRSYFLILFSFISLEAFGQKDSGNFRIQETLFNKDKQEGKVYFKTLFSPTGDTIITFHGRGDDYGDFMVEKRMGVTLEPFDFLQLTAKKGHDSILYEYPVDTITKYKLYIVGEDVNIITSPDIVIEQKNIKNERRQKCPFKNADSVNYVYTCIKKITIKMGGKTILKNFKIEWDYISAVKKENTIEKRELIDYQYPAMDGISCKQIKNRYYVRLIFSGKKIHYEEPHDMMFIERSEIFRKDFLVMRKTKKIAPSSSSGQLKR